MTLVPRGVSVVRVHLVDGTYELFRQYFGQPPRASADGREVAATYGVVTSVLGMLEGGATHIGVATDHVIESFRNELWPQYKTGEGVPEPLTSQFELLEEALEALGVVVWPMVDVEADDALASAVAVVADDPRVQQILICTPDKDLAQCVVGDRIVQLDRRKDVIVNEDGVRAKFGVSPASIPDWLALVGDSADGFPGLAGWGKRSAAVVLSHYDHLDAIPDDVESWDPVVRKAVRGADRLATTLAAERGLAELFRELATLRTDKSLLGGVPELKWTGPAANFEDLCRTLRAPGLVKRAAALVAA
ncbi:MAG TPA: 5'-3' exonuclease H3TH domain-containing protein [Acidimicrobiales bacterium]|nr:5'-3' exonuclease H3TH domain-containing protein [Acidimicrobiales bacterium]